MQKKHFLGLLAAGIVLGAGLLWMLVFSKAHSQAAILVNGQLISLQELEGAYQEFLQRYRSSLNSQERLDFDKSLTGAPGAYYQLTLTSQVAEDLIRRILLQQAARRLGVQVPQSEVLEEVRRQLWRFLEQNGVPPEQIKRAINDPKTYRSTFTQDLLEQTRWQLLEERLRQRIAGAIYPSEEELRQYYEERKLRYFVPELIRVRHILIRVPEGASPENIESARLRIEELRAEWEHGSNFAELARRYSEDEHTAPDGGDYGWIQHGDPAGEAFVEAAFALRSPNDVSPPIRSKKGWHLIQLLERRPAKGQTFEEVAGDVLKDYIAETTAQRYQSWYEKYRTEADVRIQWPLLRAHRLESQDREAALREYEEIQAKGGEKDPYLGYYIARIYREKLDALQKASGEKSQIRAVTQKLVQNLKAVLAHAPDRQIFEELLKLAPDDSEAHLQFARFLLEERRWEEASAHLETTLDLQPENLEALRLHAQILMRMNEFERAAIHLERALALSSPQTQPVRFELQFQLAQAYRQLGRVEEARQQLQRILDADPEHAHARIELGTLFLDQKEYDSAIEQLQKALPSAPSPKHAEIEASLGWAYVGQGDLEKAEKAFQEALKAPSPPLEAYRGLGALAEKQGNTEEARQYYRKGLEQSVGWQEKERFALLLLRLNPADPQTRWVLADLYQQSRRYEEAAREYREILQLQPQSLTAWRNLGDAYLSLRKYAEAIDAFQKALPWAKTPQEEAGVWARILGADRVLAQQDPQQTRPSQTRLEALYHLARLFLTLGHDQKAAQHLAELLAENSAYRADEVAHLIEQLREKGVQFPQTP